MEIKYNRNQYIRIDKSVEKISKMNIYIKNYYYNFTEKIEDLELEGDENMINKYYIIVRLPIRVIFIEITNNRHRVIASRNEER